MSLEALQLPTLESLAIDGLYIQSVRPSNFSEDGRFLLSEIVIGVSSGQSSLRSVWLVQDTKTGEVLMNIADLFEYAGLTSVDIADVSVIWDSNGPQSFAIAYSDLSDQFSGSISGASRVAFWNASGLDPTVLFGSDEDIANGSISSVLLLNDDYLIVETSAFNLNPLNLDDNNGINDLYLVSLSDESLPLWITSQGDVAPNHPSILLDASYTDGTIAVVFETESFGFSSDDLNEEVDIYRAIIRNQNEIEFQLLTASVSDRSATGVLGSVSVVDNGKLLVSADGSAYQVGFESVHQDLVVIDLETGFASVVSAILTGLGPETAFYPGSVSPSENYLTVVSGSGNEDLDGQVVEIYSDSTGYRIVSLLGGEIGNDLSYGVIASDGERGGSVIAFQTSASNLGVLPNLAVLEVNIVDSAGISLFYWSGDDDFEAAGVQQKFDNLFISTASLEYTGLNIDEPTNYLNLMDWVDYPAVSLRAKVSAPGEIAVSDIILSIQAYLGVSSLSATAFAAADVNGDDSIQVSDIVASIQLYLGLSELDGVIQFIDPVSGGRDFAPVIGETLDLTAVLLGDVDGSWSPEII